MSQARDGRALLVTVMSGNRGGGRNSLTAGGERKRTSCRHERGSRLCRVPLMEKTHQCGNVVIKRRGGKVGKILGRRVQ